MASNSNSPESFYTPKTTYNLPTAGFAVWIVCLTISYVFPNFTPYQFRIIAVIFSLIFSVSLFIKNKNWHKIEYSLLIILNAALIFINATGINTITTNYEQNESKFKNSTEQLKTASFFNLSKQKNWWPDNKLIYQNDSLIYITKTLEKKNERLLNHFSYLKDWVNTVIKDKKSLDTMNSFFTNFGNHNEDTADMLLLKLSKLELQKELYETKLKLAKRTSMDYYYQSQGKRYTPEQYVTKIGKELIESQNNMENIRVYLNLEQRDFDSLLVVLKKKYN